MKGYTPASGLPSNRHDDTSVPKQELHIRTYIGRISLRTTIIQSRIIFLLGAAFAASLSACATGGAATTTTAARTNTATTTPVADSTATWPGVYLGTLPCADCDGIQTALLLRRDASYQLATQRLGPKGQPGELRVHQGRLSFNRSGTEITLDSVTAAPDRYKIGEGQLVKLDSAGQVVTGALAARYVLKKQINPGKP